MTVAAVTSSGHSLIRSPGTNYGVCCDLFAPAAGTGVAAALVAGTIAGIRGDDFESGPAWLVVDNMIRNATEADINNRLGTPAIIVHASVHYNTPAAIDQDWIPIVLGVCIITGAILL